MYVVQVRVLVLVPVFDDFTALHGMQTPSSDEVSVCLSICQTRAIGELLADIVHGVQCMWYRLEF